MITVEEYKKQLKMILAVTVILLAGFLVFVALWFKTMNSILAQAPVCPEGNGWSQHQDPPFTPVDNAIKYCFFAGGHQTDTYPDGGFGQTGACNAQNIQRCDLSHWSYRLGEVEPSITPSVTPSPTPTATPTAVPTATPTPGLSKSAPPEWSDPCFYLRDHEECLTKEEVFPGETKDFGPAK